MAGNLGEASLWDTLFDTIVVPRGWREFVLTGMEQMYYNVSIKGRSLVRERGHSR